MSCDFPLVVVFCHFNFRSFRKIKIQYYNFKCASVPNLMKQLFHSRKLDMRLVIANSALRASLAIYHLISNALLE